LRKFSVITAIIMVSLFVLTGCQADPVTTTVTTTAPAITNTVTYTTTASPITKTETITTTISSQPTTESSATTSSTSNAPSGDIAIEEISASSSIQLLNLEVEKQANAVVLTGTMKYNFGVAANCSVYAEFYDANDNLLYMSNPQSWYLALEEEADFTITYETDNADEVVKILVITFA
jgi:hypothetical protein